MFGKKKQQEKPAGPKTSTKCGALWERHDDGEEKTSGVILQGLSVRVYHNDYKKTEKDADFNLVCYIPKNKAPEKACMEAFLALEAVFKDLGINPDQVFAQAEAAGGDDVPF